MRTALVSLESQMFVEGIAGLTKFAVCRVHPDAEAGVQSYDPFDRFEPTDPSRR